MKSMEKAKLINQRLQGHLDYCYRFIMEGLTEFWGYSQRYSVPNGRGIEMFFFWHEGQDPQPLRDRIDEGVEWLRKLTSSGQWSEKLKPIGEPEIERDDTEGANKLLVILKVRLSHNLRERLELTVYDQAVNGLLTRRAVYVHYREIYLNYEREAYRLSKTYRDETLRHKLAELKQGPIYSQLDQGILGSIDSIVAGT